MRRLNRKSVKMEKKRLRTDEKSQSFKLEQLRRKRDLFRKHKDYHRIFNLWRDFDLITTIITISGLFLAIVNYEIETGRYTDPINKHDYPDAKSHPRVAHA